MDSSVLILIFLVLALVFMFFSSRRRTAKMREVQEERQTQMVPGARVMTRDGVFGTIVEFDATDLAAPAVVEIAPGVHVDVHAQAISLAPETVPAVGEGVDSDDTDLGDGADLRVSEDEIDDLRLTEEDIDDLRVGEAEIDDLRLDLDGSKDSPPQGDDPRASS